ncbi:MAG: tRNA (adenosine(37)-N6)-threonylcarbamoyltransferase complex ATPase subunit type 1 TsaE [Ignavibacteriaceae bacterium]
MELPVSTKINSEKETKQLAEEFALGLKAGETIVINGELGAGKTFFIKSASGVLGINNVNSPTFALVHEYLGKFKIYHFDFYRINEVKELYDIGFDDYLNDEEAIVFIEWGNLFPEILPHKRIEIEILVMEDFSREITIAKLNPNVQMPKEL